MSIEAVFRSWNNRRAIDYRNLNKIADDLGTAVNVQAMVFGNMGDSSATGVAFTRNPSTGEPGLFGEYLVNAQGEDVVAGIRTPKPHHRDAQRPESARGLRPVSGRRAAAWSTTTATCRTWSSRSRRAASSCSRPAPASAPGRRPCGSPSTWSKEGLIDRATAVQRVEPAQLDQLLHPMIDPE